MTISDWADKIGITKAQASLILNERMQISEAMLLRILPHLGNDETWILYLWKKTDNHIRNTYKRILQNPKLYFHWINLFNRYVTGRPEFLYYLLRKESVMLDKFEAEEKLLPKCDIHKRMKASEMKKLGEPVV